VRKVVSLIVAMLLLVMLFPLSILTSSSAVAADDDIIVDPIVLEELTDQVRAELLGNVKKTSVSAESVDLGGGLIVSKTAYNGIKALGNKAKVVVELNDPSFFNSGKIAVIRT